MYNILYIKYMHIRSRKHVHVCMTQTTCKTVSNAACTCIYGCTTLVSGSSVRKMSTVCNINSCTIHTQCKCVHIHVCIPV